MNPLWDPVGPLERGVYWRRRAAVLLGLAVVLLLVVRSCTGDDASEKPGSPTAATTSATASPTASASASPSRSSSAATTKPAAARACTDADVAVTARPAKRNYAVGDTVNLTFVVSTKSGVRCKRDVGGSANEVRVVSGGNLIWSSDVCSPGGSKDVRTIGPDDAYSVIVEWDGTVAAASCPDERLLAPAGDYQVIGRNGDVLSQPAALTLG